ncbi:MAG: hypothetical protein K6G52_05740, partial [Treponemataceae bacterium]|nr:hypothetical protein [Treponemataceae bacterium]
MKKTILTILCITFIFNIVLFARETVLAEKDYPLCVKYMIYPSERPDDYDGLVFGTDEKLDKVTKDTSTYILYSHDENCSYRCVFNKNGNVIENKGWFTNTDKEYFYSQYSIKSPYKQIYYKKYFYDADDDHSYNTYEAWYENTDKNRLIKSSDTWRGDFDRKYNSDGSYEVKCTKVAEGADNIYSYVGSIQYFDKDGNWLSVYTNNESKKSRFFEESIEFQNMIKTYNISLDMSLDEDGDRIFTYFYQTYEYQNGTYSEIIGIGQNHDLDDPIYLLEISTDGTITWYNKDGNISRVKTKDD